MRPLFACNMRVLLVKSGLEISMQTDLRVQNRIFDEIRDPPRKSKIYITYHFLRQKQSSIAQTNRRYLWAIIACAPHHPHGPARSTKKKTS